MNEDKLKSLLTSIAKGTISPEEGFNRIKDLPFHNLGFAKIDTHRELRTNHPEFIFGGTKTLHHLEEIIKAMITDGISPIVVTKVPKEKGEVLQKTFPHGHYDELPGLFILGEKPNPSPKKDILILCGGTSDLYVAEEAAIISEYLGNSVTRRYDVGVAGIHRLFSYKEDLQKAKVIICIAGMEGALVSVVGGLVRCPVIGVPTSVGYGASFQGLAPLLTMLNSCAPGTGVVNIDNGFGAAYLADLIIKGTYS